MATRMMLLALATLLVAPLAWAELPDPTAPTMSAASDAGGNARPAIALTAIMVRDGKRKAIIGGQEIAVGGRYQDARVVRIDESEVVLRNGKEVTVLKLYPLVDKRLRGK